MSLICVCVLGAAPCAPCRLESYRGPGASALPALMALIDERPTGVDLAVATEVITAETGLSAPTVHRAWLVLIDLDLIAPVYGNAPRIGRHREAHARVWWDR